MYLNSPDDGGIPALSVFQGVFLCSYGWIRGVRARTRALQGVFQKAFMGSDYLNVSCLGALHPSASFWWNGMFSAIGGSKDKLEMETCEESGLHLCAFHSSPVRNRFFTGLHFLKVN